MRTARLARSFVQGARDSARAAISTQVLIAFEFKDGTVEAYGPDAFFFWSYENGSKDAPTCRFEDDTQTTHFTASIAVMKRLAADIGVWHHRPVVIIDADSFEGLFDG